VAAIGLAGENRVYFASIEQGKGVIKECKECSSKLRMFKAVLDKPPKCPACRKRMSKLPNFKGASEMPMISVSFGNMEWNKTYGGSGKDEAYCVQQTSDGGYILAGSTESYGAGLADPA
jgi:hypothetical protein